MKIVAIHGSPRKGNSSAITDHLLLSAEEVSAKTNSYYLNKLTFRGCQACYACKTTSDRCVLDDDLAPVLDAIQEADVIVLASPVYFGDITGQLKSFFDRTFSFFTPDYRTAANPSRLPSGKKLVFIQTQGNADPDYFGDIYPRYDRFFKRFGFTETRLIRGVGLAATGDISKLQEYLRHAENVAAEFVAKGDVDW